MIQTNIINGPKPQNYKYGTFIFALFSKDKVVHIGQCDDIHAHLDENICANLVFDRFTYTFLDGVAPYSDVSNMMEAVAISRLMPALAVAPETELYADLVPSAGKVIYRLENETYSSPQLLLTIEPNTATFLEVEELQLAV